MPKKKSTKKKARYSPSLFKVTGASAKMKTDTKKKKLYYFKEKVKPEKASKSAAGTAAEILGVSTDALKLRKPSLKYDFYSMYDATLDMKFLRINKVEIGALEGMKAALVGKEVLTPKKGKDVPGKAIFLDVVELFESERTDALTLDGSTGTPARTMEKLLKGPGKKTASAAWIRKVSVSSGKFNTIEKVIKAVEKMAGKAPAEAKRVVEHKLTFTKLAGFYVPTYYVKATAGTESRTLRINAVNGNVSLKI
ncbi:MAG: hypothetical protein RTU30_14895 [Candidatus Thorarchaeota archaeon]